MDKDILNAQTIREIRRKTGLTQEEFCKTFGFKIDALKSWEIGRRVPDGGNLILLKLIGCNPKPMAVMIRRVL